MTSYEPSGCGLSQVFKWIFGIGKKNEKKKIEQPFEYPETKGRFKRILPRLGNNSIYEGPGQQKYNFYGPFDPLVDDNSETPSSLWDEFEVFPTPSPVESDSDPSPYYDYRSSDWESDLTSTEYENLYDFRF